MARRIRHPVTTYLFDSSYCRDSSDRSDSSDQKDFFHQKKFLVKFFEWNFWVNVFECNFLIEIYQMNFASEIFRVKFFDWKLSFEIFWLKVFDWNIWVNFLMWKFLNDFYFFILSEIVVTGVTKQHGSGSSDKKCLHKIQCQCSTWNLHGIFFKLDLPSKSQFFVTTESKNFLDSLAFSALFPPPSNNRVQEFLGLYFLFQHWPPKKFLGLYFWQQLPPPLKSHFF